jgi:hypothetical protein
MLSALLTMLTVLRAITHLRVVWGRVSPPLTDQFTTYSMMNEMSPATAVPAVATVHET